MITVDKCYVFWHPYKDNTPPPEKIKPKNPLNEFGQALFNMEAPEENRRNRKAKAE